MNASSLSVSVVIPVYNSAAILPDLLAQLDEELSPLTEAFEVILVNDGSSDGSWPLIQLLAAERPHVRGLDLMRNYGQHNALLAGIRLAQHDLIVTMDDDLQHPPSQVVHLLNRLLDGADVVYGVPQTEQHGLLRDVASVMTKMVLQHAMGADIARRISAFRAFRTELRQAFANYAGSFISIDVLLTWATTRFAAVAVEHHPRRMGKSAYTMRKLITHAVNMLTGFSTLPLQFASMIGFAFTAFGLVVLVYVIGRLILHGDPVPGFPFLASIITIFSGAQLFALGIIGEYLSRAHFRLMDKPAYSVRRDTRAGSGPDPSLDPRRSKRVEAIPPGDVSGLSRREDDR